LFYSLPLGFFPKGKTANDIYVILNIWLKGGHIFSYGKMVISLSEEKYVASVAVSKTSLYFDKRYKYIVPKIFEETLKPGCRVVVPFGKGNHRRIGVVLELIPIEELPESEDISSFKPVNSAVDPVPPLTDEMVGLIPWLRENTFCTYFDAFRTMIPVGLNVNFSERYIAAGNTDESILSDSAKRVWADYCEDVSSISKASHTDIEELVEKGFLIESDEIKRRKRDSTVKMLRLTEEYLSDEQSFNLSEKGSAVVDLLENCGAAAVKEVMYFCGVSESVISTLKKNGVVEKFENEYISETYAEITEDDGDIVLSEEQQTVFDGISALMELGEPQAALLYGVTGSGKTAVFIKLIRSVLEKGRNVIMLIPEISLTPQVVNKFKSYFGSLVSVMHSGLSLTQRLDEFKRVKSGKSRIVVGTRSAVFAPLENIGIIIMDEEGESSYKSESSPRYNARDVAKKRCVYHNALLLMASATPSIESSYYASTGRYKLFTMKKRYSQDRLPDVEIIDLATEGFYDDSAILSERLADELSINLSRGEQSILLLNRRGYHTFISCCDCKKTMTCPNCSVPLTYHKANNMLVCHYCGHIASMIKSCPYCGKNHIKQTGFGTQKVEDAVAKLFPDARILRMDADTTYSRTAFEKNFKAFENGEYDIMLGTQMIAKGLDFPNVTLVGVVSIDKALFCGDFRSYERTFSLLTQVVGRCGRGDKQGRAYIQTFVPDHYVINLAAAQNYNEFCRQELENRKALLFPPFCDTCLIEFSSEMDNCARDAAKKFMELIKEKIKNENIRLPLRVLEPSRCTYEKLCGRFRYRIIIKCKNNADFRKFIGEIYINFPKVKEYANVRSYIDINGDISI